MVPITHEIHSIAFLSKYYLCDIITQFTANKSIMGILYRGDIGVARLLIRERRWEQGLSAEQLGRLIGLSESTIIRIENGQRDPKFQQLVQIAKILECKISDLYTEDE